MDPSRRTTREERARRRAEEAAERADRAIAERGLRERRAELVLEQGGGEEVISSATRGTRERDSTVGVQRGLDRSHQGHDGKGGNQMGTRRRRRAGATLNEVGVLEVVVPHHGDQPVEEIRDAAEEGVERVAEVGPGVLAIREVVELEIEVNISP